MLVSTRGPTFARIASRPFLDSDDVLTSLAFVTLAALAYAAFRRGRRDFTVRIDPA